MEFRSKTELKDQSLAVIFGLVKIKGKIIGDREIRREGIKIKLLKI